MPYRLHATLAAVLTAIVLLSSPVPRASAGATLHWTAPGDDGTIGTATRYDVRRSTQPLTEANFAQAETVGSVPRPSAAGRPESCAVALPVPGVRYYFAVKTVDEVGNWSTISNVASWVAPTLAVEGPAFTETRFAPPWPNPSRGAVRLRLELPLAMNVAIEIFDVAGRHVRSLRRETLRAGAHELEWDLHDDRGARAAAGLYFVRARLGTNTATHRIVIAP